PAARNVAVGGQADLDRRQQRDRVAAVDEVGWLEARAAARRAGGLAGAGRRAAARTRRGGQRLAGQREAERAREHDGEQTDEQSGSRVVAWTWHRGAPSVLGLYHSRASLARSTQKHEQRSARRGRSATIWARARPVPGRRADRGHRRPRPPA